MTNRELNALLAEKVMGWHKVDGFYPSTCIRDAWKVVEALCRGPFKGFYVVRGVGGSWTAYFWSYDVEGSKRHGSAGTAPKAICLAALQAVRVEAP